MNTEKKTRDMVMAGAFCSIIILMAIVPVLGYIPLGFMNATIIHIPVIIGAILLGPRYGGFLGLVFGLTSMWKNTFMPNATSFVFSPFATVPGGYTGNFGSVIICLAPRILIGIAAYYVYRSMEKLLNFLKSRERRQRVSLLCAGVAGSLTNTLLVMNLIYFFFGRDYAEASGKAIKGFYYIIMGVICFNGIPEAILAGIFTAVITSVLWKVKKG